MSVGQVAALDDSLRRDGVLIKTLVVMTRH